MIARLHCFVLLGALMASSALAQTQPIPAPPIIGAKSFLMIDGTTGHELASLQADERLAPASLTKLMTAYVVFQSLGSGQVTLDDLVTVSEKVRGEEVVLTVVRGDETLPIEMTLQELGR